MDKKAWISNEILKYNEARIDSNTLEVDGLDFAVLLHVIRRREYEILDDFLCREKLGIVLDFGSGSGWLLKHLARAGYKAIGIDIAANLLKKAKLLDEQLELIVSDAHLLPFRNRSFDSTICIGILHHLRTDALIEVARTTKRQILIMEPNWLNFLTYIGRKSFPTELHTQYERPLNPSSVKSNLQRLGFVIHREYYLFAFAFPLARILRILNRSASKKLIIFLLTIERFFERIPVLSKTNSIFVIHGVRI